jgi:hypothetical protein
VADEKLTADELKQLVESINPGGKISRLQWVSVVGVGTFLIVGIVPWMMWMISVVIPANTEALIGIEKQAEDVEDELARTRRAIIKLSGLIQVEDPEDNEG